MSRLEELIAELCPDGVEYKKLGSFATVSRGGNFQKKEFTENGVPCVHYGQIYTRYGLFADTTFTFISEETARKQKFAQRNDIIMAVTSENIEDVCKCIGWLGEGEVAVSGHAAIIHHNQDPKYLTYWFHTVMFFAQKRKIAHGTKVIEVTPDKLLDIVIPVPPLPVQREIVKILDNFTGLTAELTAELTARQKQYDYYTKKLFFGLENARTVLLGSIATIKTGTKPSVINEEKMQYEYINAGTSNSGFTDGYNCDGDVVTTPSRGQGGIGFVAYQKRKFWLGPLCYRIQSKDNEVVDNKYIYYYLSCHKEKILQYKKEGGTPAVNASDLAMIDVIIPTIEKQQKIIDILDRFEALCNDISDGLPAEIAARQKQYKYYRDKLLTFKPLA